MVLLGFPDILIISQITHLVDQLGFLLCRAELEEFLDDVITKDVRHQTVGGGEDLLEHQLLLSGSGPLQLLLDEPGAVLVLAELHDVVGEVSQLEVGVAIVPAIYSMNDGCESSNRIVCRETQSQARAELAGQS